MSTNTESNPNSTILKSKIHNSAIACILSGFLSPVIYLSYQYNFEGHIPTLDTITTSILLGVALLSAGQFLINTTFKESRLKHYTELTSVSAILASALPILLQSSQVMLSVKEYITYSNYLIMPLILCLTTAVAMPCYYINHVIQADSTN